MTACAPADQLLAFVAGELPAAIASELEAHIDACPSCRAALSSLARGERDAPAYGRYRLDTVIGSGGMGIVYRAWDPELARAIAIKVVKHADADDTERARLIREARALARLAHPHVCRIYDVGETAGELWIAMELIDGTTLGQWAAGAGRSIADVTAALLAAADGLAAAHAAGIVHRDVKPQNVLVARDGRAVVSDFGLARSAATERATAPNGGAAPAGDSRLTATGMVAGTPAYAAPEQLAGDAIDARMDQFAWAVMAWELLTGARPFPIAPAARLAAIRAGVVAPRDLPAPLGAALVRALSPSPSARFASMAELIAAAVPASASVSASASASASASVSASASASASARRRRLVIVGLALAAAAMLAAYFAQRDDTPASVALAPSASDARIPLSEIRSPLPDAAAVTPITSPASIDAAVALPAPIAPHPPRVAATASAPTTPTTAPPHARHVESAAERATAEAVLDQECVLPYNAAKPDPAQRGELADWGRVTRREAVIAHVGDRPQQLTMFEVAGARRSYRFKRDYPLQFDFDADVGDLVVVCPAGDTDIFQLPPPWTGTIDTLRAALRVSAPPRITELASLAPLHIQAARLRADSHGQLRLPTDRAYLVRARIGAVGDDGRHDMAGWWLEVPADARGAALATEGAWRWIVVDQLAMVDARVVARARAVIADMFPQ